MHEQTNRSQYHGQADIVARVGNGIMVHSDGIIYKRSGVWPLGDGSPQRGDACMEEMRDRARLCLYALDAHLDGREFLLAYGYTGADIMMSYSVRGFCRHCPDDVLPSRVAAYYDRLCARPSWISASAVDAGE